MVHRERNHIERRIKAPRFPVLKELADFDLSSVLTLSTVYVLDLAGGEYIAAGRSPVRKKGETA